MKKYSLLILIVLLLISCSNQKQQGSLPTVDVTKSYPKKEIVLQDIADVEYIPLETRDDVLLDDMTCLCRVSADTVIVGNYYKGDIFIFNGKGKIINHFNKKGASGEECREIRKILFDKSTQEIYVLDAFFNYRIQVYDYHGKYKRTLPIAHQYYFSSNEMFIADNKQLICYDRERDGLIVKDTLKQNLTPFVYISKSDGKVTRHLPLKLSKRVKANVKFTWRDRPCFSVANLYSIVDNKKNWIISEVSKDTIFTCSKQTGKLVPIVVRQPKVQQMKRWYSFLQIEKISSRYLYGKIIKQQESKKSLFDHFQTKRIFIDRKTKEIYEYQIINKDMPKSKRFIEWLKPKHQSMLLEMDWLKEALEKGELRGKLKTIVEKLKEDDNPILMKITFKK